MCSWKNCLCFCGVSQIYFLGEDKNFLLSCFCKVQSPFFFVPTGYFFTGDGAYRSKEGYYQITGRLDDVINVSGHRIGTAEIEDVVVRSIKD